MRAYQHQFDSLSLYPGTGGVFDVVVDDELIWSKAEHGRHANPGEVLDALRAHAG